MHSVAPRVSLPWFTGAGNHPCFSSGTRITPASCLSRAHQRLARPPRRSIIDVGRPKVVFRRVHLDRLRTTAPHDVSRPPAENPTRRLRARMCARRSPRLEHRHPGVPARPLKPRVDRTRPRGRVACARRARLMGHLMDRTIFSSSILVIWVRRGGNVYPIYPFGS